MRLMSSRRSGVCDTCGVVAKYFIEVIIFCSKNYYAIYSVLVDNT